MGIADIYKFPSGKVKKNKTKSNGAAVQKTTK
jgi:hypothetical protein